MIYKQFTAVIEFIAQPHAVLLKPIPAPKWRVIFQSTVRIVSTRPPLVSS